MAESHKDTFNSVLNLRWSCEKTRSAAANKNPSQRYCIALKEKKKFNSSDRSTNHPIIQYSAPRLSQYSLSLRALQVNSKKKAGSQCAVAMEEEDKNLLYKQSILSKERENSTPLIDKSIDLRRHGDRP